MTNIQKKKEEGLSITKTYDLAKPVEAVQMAVVLKNLIVKQNLYTQIKGKNYAHVDAWQLAGFLTGMTAVVEEPKNIATEKGEIKWSCAAKLYSGEKVVGVGYALCSSKEATKKNFDEYAILSMAQTRAIGKAYRNKIGFIIKLAGYESTPSEEMRKVDEVPKEPSETRIVPDEDIKNAIVCQECDDIITQAEQDFSMKIYKKALCRNCQKSHKAKK